MDRHAGDDSGDQAPQAPGTLALEDFQLSGNSLILHPIPTADPNDPLNWSFWRKTVNISLVMLYVTLTFTQLDIGLVAYEQYLDELGFSVNDLNGANALGYAGLGFGSVFFIPLMHKYGRRPVYIASLTLQVGACIWLALTKTKADLWVGNALAGLGGAVCETIVQVTIADIFFVHQHASLNAYYLFFTSVGASLAPVAAGYVVESQGWRWIWWWSVILIAANLVLVIFLFEESKYVVIMDGQDDSNPQGSHHDEAAEEMDPAKVDDVVVQTRSHRHINSRIPAKSYLQRMALLTTTDGPVFGHILDPFVVLATFPAVTFAAITFGSLLALFALLAAVQAIYLLEPPYNFSAIGVGLMNLAPVSAGR
ncbi:hypothetical protein K4F52_001170 [Lecanicillium sp. MT-2017a]|nr:hypothetical protein K4F52_001170 [Lecanicillium sp. MT-2017a]